MGLPSILAFGGSGSGGGGAAFSTIQPDAGTSPVATGADTLTLTSVDNSLVITGDSATDKITFSAGSNLTLLGGRSSGQVLNGGTAPAEALTLQSTAHATKGKILFAAIGVVDEANTRMAIGMTAPAYRFQCHASADDYTHGFAISHGLGGANALTRFYQDLNGVFSCANPNQGQTHWASTAIGQLMLTNGNIASGGSVNVRTHPDYLARHTLVLANVASQTGKLLVLQDTDLSSELFSIDKTGKLRSSSGNESTATLGTAIATEYLAVLLSSGATRYIPLVTTRN